MSISLEVIRERGTAKSDVAALAAADRNYQLLLPIARPNRPVRRQVCEQDVCVRIKWFEQDVAVACDGDASGGKSDINR